MANVVPLSRRVSVVKALVEGNSIRSTVRMTDVAKNTVTSLLVDLGQACAAYHDKDVRGLKSKRVQCDEIWSFCYSKQKNVPEQHEGEFGYGDVWTWTAIDADSKLIVSYLVGSRDGECAKLFIDDVASRLTNRVQLTTDGHKPYLEAVEGAFGADIDYAMLIKIFGGEGSNKNPETRYSPAVCTGIEKRVVQEKPAGEHVSTSYVERQNLTMRMAMRRFTRLTNGFSKKVYNHECAVALHFFHYNYCRIHQTLRVTPAMEAGLTEHVWSIEELIGLLDWYSKLCASENSN